ATLVRWMGCARVRTFLERAYETLHQSDPSRLYAYANYPSTEYLQPRNGDFAAFNIYLEERDAVRRYVRRLHHLADDRPLVISEYGLDSVRNGEPLQAETGALAWSQRTGRRSQAPRVWRSLCEKWVWIDRWIAH
ncbi:MAG: glycosyltransferase, partial [Verrucomicrobiales bacterium]